MHLPSTMRAEMAGLGRVHPVIEFDIAGITYRFAEQPVKSDSEGMYKGDVVSWGSWGRRAGHVSFSLEVPEFTTEIFDADRVLQKAIGGPARNLVRGSTVRRWWRSFYVPASDHYEAFSGVIKNYSLRDRNYAFRVGPDTTVLEGSPKIPFLTKADFPTAPESVMNQPLWIVIGAHASGAVPGANGMVRCLPATLDSNGDSIEWIVSYGQGTVQSLYFNDTKDTANWQFFLQQRGKNFYQMAHYSGGGTKPKPSDNIKVDMNGIRSQSPHVAGGGTTIVNPAEALRRVIGHFGYGDGDMRPGVQWTSEANVPVATAAMDEAETYFSDRGDRMARVIKADQSLFDIISEWCDDFSAAPFWSDSWEIGAKPEDEGEVEIYQDSRHISQKEGHALSPLSGHTFETQPIQALQVNYLLNEAEGAFARSGRVFDPRAIGTLRDQFDIENGVAEVE